MEQIESILWFLTCLFIFAIGSTRDLRPTGLTTHNRRLQRGLDVRDKARRVCQYADPEAHTA